MWVLPASMAESLLPEIDGSRQSLLLHGLSWHCLYMIQEVAVIRCELLTGSVHDTRSCCYTVWATDRVCTWYKKLLLYSVSYWQGLYMIQEVAVLPSVQCRHKVAYTPLWQYLRSELCKILCSVEVCSWLCIGRLCLFMWGVIMW
jgi:hypothetical protein